LSLGDATAATVDDRWVPLPSYYHSRCL